MKNFTFHNPTKIVFGQGQISKLNSLIPAGSKIMITMGGGSIFRNGVYDQVKRALDGRTWIEFSGIEANPDYGMCHGYSMMYLAEATHVNYYRRDKKVCEDYAADSGAQRVLDY
ncbi:MAG: iron-containing alcohol dehydrogenase, partial [Mucinivorans sp.]